MVASLADTSWAAVWAALPSILWIVFGSVVLIYLRQPVRDLLAHLVTRVQDGASVKLWTFELGSLKTEQQKAPAAFLGAPESERLESQVVASDDPVTQEAIELSIVRQAFCRDTRKIMVAHRLFQSAKPGQTYDVLIYLLPHGDSTLVQVTGVEYFFGRYWKNEVFSSYDRSRGFPVMTSAYGPFLCTARISLNDGTKQILFRYIDFEMGGTAPRLTS